MNPIEFPLNTQAQDIILQAINLREQFSNEYLMPEHILLALVNNKPIQNILASYFDIAQLVTDTTQYLTDNKEENISLNEVEFSALGNTLCVNILANADFSHTEEISVPFLFHGLYYLENSHASYLLHKNQTGAFAEALQKLIILFEDNKQPHTTSPITEEDPNEEAPATNTYFYLNDHTDLHTPVIGRANELERIMQILCRKEKNNPLLVGESGVGKTAIIYGLAELINKDEVPLKLTHTKIVELNITQFLAGAQFRGQFEERIKNFMENISSDGQTIVFIDDFHLLIGAGTTSDSSIDAIAMLKPYFDNDTIRFIGCTTYEMYNKIVSKNNLITRRFHQVDIREPSVEDTIQMLQTKVEKYETYHHVKYTPEAIEHAVKASAQYISNRHLPDKAFDLIDEAGAYSQTHRPSSDDPDKIYPIEKELIDAILFKVCKIDAKVLQSKENNNLLQTLEQDILSQIYGQNHAVTQLVEAIQMSKAGLLDDNKPIASLLFVGPTGVGKTELCKVLAEKLGITMIRFDMSEYTEKHTVAKLIGSPAGYVGYDDGGLLTSAVNNTPNCVLLLDEIEKAHSDIFNILLQVMDYASLTDNKGQKTDFRHVILVMTSNAGAQYAHQANIGFGSRVTAGNAMMSQVKRTFKPEFINRLNDIVVFNDMDETMAEMILNKKLSQLQTKLKNKNIHITISEEAHKLLLTKGFSKEYGAREMDRTIHSYLTTLLTKEILFGSLKDGGDAHIEVHEEKLILNHPQI